MNSGLISGSRAPLAPASGQVWGPCRRAARARITRQHGQYQTPLYAVDVSFCCFARLTASVGCGTVTTASLWPGRYRHSALSASRADASITGASGLILRSHNYSVDQSSVDSRQLYRFPLEGRRDGPQSITRRNGQGVAPQALAKKHPPHNKCCLRRACSHSQTGECFRSVRLHR